MSAKKSELEDRLDDMLSRIAMETQEIKELEQQLTDGQILANEALQRDLEGIICGLQEYLRGLREQAGRAQQQVHSLQAENQRLQLHLEDTQRHCRHLEDITRTHTQVEAQTDRQVELEAQTDRQVELEAELQQLREELTRQTTLGQLQCDSLQAAVEKEKQISEIRESQLQSAIDTLQDDKSCLQHSVQTLQAQLDQTRIQLDQVTADLLDAEEVQRGPGENRPEDMLSRSMDRLHRAIQQTRTSRERLQQDHNHSQEQIARLQAQLDHDEDHIAKLKAQVAQDQDQDLDLGLKGEQEGRSEDRVEAELQQSRWQLQDVRQERDRLLQQLRSQSDGHQRSLGRLSRKLRKLSRSMSDTDQLTAEQLKDTTNQLRALRHTVELLHTHTEQEHTHTQCEHTHMVEQLRAELEKAQRHTHTLRQELDRTRTRSRTRTSTKDGGRWCFVPPGLSAHSLGSQGTHDSGLGLHYLGSPEGGRQQERPAAGGGSWVYVVPTRPGSDSEWTDGGPAEAGSSTGPPTDPPGPPTDPPAPPTDHLGPQLQTPLLGPAWLLCAPPAGGDAPHCNIPEHRDKVDRCVCECAERAEEEKKKKLRLDSKRTLRRHRRVMQVCDEVVCVEKTLQKRRAELRRADRLLLEAQSCIHTSRDEASSARRQAATLQRSAQDGALCLLEATQHARELQEEVEELRNRRQEEEQTLREVEEALRSREEELQLVSTDVHSATDRLAGVLSGCQEAQRRLDSLSNQVQQQEQKLLLQKEEHHSAVSRVEEVREEERRLQHRVQELLSDRQSTLSTLREDEQRLITVQTELNTHRADLKQILQELLVEQKALEEVKTKRSHSEQRLHRKQDELDAVREEVDRKQEEVDRKQEEVDRKQEEVDRKQEVLAELGQEVVSRRKEAGICQQETKLQRAELQELQEELSRRLEERSRVEEQCKQLEARRRHAHRCLAAVQVELSHAQLLKQEVVRDTAATQEQLKEKSELLSELSRQLEEHRGQLEQAVCAELDRVTAAVCQQEDRGRRLSRQQLEEELKEREKELKHQEEELKHQEEELKHQEEELKQREEGLKHQEEELKRQEEELKHQEEELKHQEEELKRQEEELKQREEELKHQEEELKRQEEELKHQEEEILSKPEERHVTEDEQEESFYLSTAGLRSAFSTERQILRRQEDRLKARLRCRLWDQQEALTARRLEAEESVQGLKHRLDQLDSLLTHTP